MNTKTSAQQARELAEKCAKSIRESLGNGLRYDPVLTTGKTVIEATILHELNLEQLIADKPIEPPKPIIWLACDSRRCGWHGDSETVLRAPDPFNEGCELMACPQCREQTIRTCCDYPGCWEQDTCGTPTPKGYRRTCGPHQPKD